MSELNEGDACPLCGGTVHFSPLGECTCWSGAGTSSWSPGPCRACKDGDLFCKKCELYADEIIAELDRRALKMPEQVVQETHKSAGGAGAKPSPLHHMPLSTGVLAAHELWLPGTRGHRS